MLMVAGHRGASTQALATVNAVEDRRHTLGLVQTLRNKEPVQTVKGHPTKRDLAMWSCVDQAGAIGHHVT